MEEYTWETAVGAHWRKIEIEYNARWAKMAKLDGPDFTVWDRIEAKRDLEYFARSSSHGVENSIRKPQTEPCSPNLISSMADLNRQHNLRMADYAQEIRESYARILGLLQEEIDAADSTNDALSTSGETLPSMEPIEKHSVTNADSSCVEVTIETTISPSRNIVQSFDDNLPVSDAFLTSLAVLLVSEKNSKEEEVNLASDLNSKIFNLLEVTKPNSAKSLDLSKIDVENHVHFSCAHKYDGLHQEKTGRSTLSATTPLHVIFGFDPGGNHAWKGKWRLDFDNVFLNCSSPSVLGFHQRNDTLLMSLHQLVIGELQGISIKPISLFETTMRVLGGLLPSHFIATNKVLVFDTTTVIAFASVDLLQAVDPHEIKLMIIVGDGILTLEFRILSYCPNNPIAEDVSMIVVFLWALCAILSQIGVGIAYQQTHQIYASLSISWFKLNAHKDFLLLVERPLNITFFWNIVLFQYMNTISTRPRISPSQKIKLSLANVIIACNAFESLLLGRQGLASLVQKYSAISVECKELSFGYFIGSAFKPYVVAFGLAKLAKVGDYSCSSTLIVGSFGYLVWINGYVTTGDHKSLILVNFESVWKLFRYMAVGIFGMCSLQDNRVVRGGWQELPFTVDDVRFNPSLFLQLLPLDLVDSISQGMTSLSYKHQLIDDCVSQSCEITIKTATFDHCGMALVDTSLSNLRGALLPQLTSYSQNLILECIEVEKYKVPELENDQQVKVSLRPFDTNEPTSISQANLHVLPKMDILKVFYNTSSKIPVNSNLMTILWKASSYDTNIPAHVFFLTLIIAELFGLFSKEFIEIKSLVSADWEQMVVEMLDKFETNLIFLNDTTVENRLQNRVSSCLGRPAHMGIQPWVLSGDTIKIVLTIAFAFSFLFQGRQLIINCFNTPETKSFDAIDVKSAIGVVHHMQTRLLILGIYKSFAIIGTKYINMGFGPADCAIFSLGALFSLSFGSAQQWDPRGQFDMSTTTRTYQFKQWDPGKFVQQQLAPTLRTRLFLMGRVMS